jgi:TP901 family phage tail tape measure protein
VPRLETTLEFRAVDEAGRGFEAMRARLAALDKQVAGVTKSIASVEKVDKRVGASARTFGAMETSIRQVAAASKGLGGELDRLQTAQGKLGAFKSLSSDFRAAREAFSNARKEVRDLAKEMRVAEAPAKALARQHDAAKLAAVEAKAAYASERETLQRLRSEKESGGAGPEIGARIKEQTQAASSARAALRAARVEAEELGKQVTAAQAPLLRLTRDFTTAQKAVEGASKNFQLQKTALAGLKDEFEELAGPMKRLEGGVMSIREAEARLGSDIERANAQLREQGITAARTGEQLEAAARREEQAAMRRAERIEAWKTAAAFGGVMLAQGAEHEAKEVIEIYRDFDKERRFGRAVMGISDEQQKPLVDQAIHGGGTTKYNDIQYLEAQRELAARGLKIDQILGLIPAGATLGMATDQDLPSAVKQIESGIFGFKKDTSTREAAVDAATRTADLMTKAAKISGMTPEDEVQLYKRGANPAHMAHVSEETLLAFGGTLKRANIGGDEASTAFRALIAASLSPTAGARTALLANGMDYSHYQHMRDHLDLDPFVSDIAQKYGVRLDADAQARIGKVFGDKDMIADPAKFTPAIVDVLRDVLGGPDAKALKSIAGEANRYRAASASGVDVDNFIVDLMKKLPGNLALANALFGAKQGGRISTALGDPETFAKMLKALVHDAEGYAGKIAEERMTGFDAAVAKLDGSLKNVATSIGRSWDEGEKGGALTNVATGLGWLAQHFAELDTTTVKLTSGLLAAGAATVGLWGAFRIAKTMLGFAGSAALTGSATALTGSAGMLDEAAIALGAKGAGPAVGPGGVAKKVAGPAEEIAKDTPAAAGSWFSRMFGLGSVFTAVTAPASMDIAEGSGNAAAADTIKKLDEGRSNKPADVLWDILAEHAALAAAAPWPLSQHPDIEALVNRDYYNRTRPALEYPENDPEARRGRAMMQRDERSDRELKVSLAPDSKAEIAVTVRVDASSSLINAIASATAKASGNLVASVGVSTAGVAPNAPTRRA